MLRLQACVPQVDEMADPVSLESGLIVDVLPARANPSPAN
jgi:hypothetical protein